MVFILLEQSGFSGVNFLEVKGVFKSFQYQFATESVSNEVKFTL